MSKMVNLIYKYIIFQLKLRYSCVGRYQGLFLCIMKYTMGSTTLQLSVTVYKI